MNVSGCSVASGLMGVTDFLQFCLHLNVDDNGVRTASANASESCCHLNSNFCVVWFVRSRITGGRSSSRDNRSIGLPLQI